MNKINYKIASKNQVLRLSELFANVYKKKITEKELVWRYFDNPLQKGKIYNCVATNDDHEIIGHTAFIKNKFYINNKIVYGGLTVGSAVQSEYSGVFAPMYNFLEKSTTNEFDFIYGFPNQNSLLFFTKIFKYYELESNIFQFKNTSSNFLNDKLKQLTKFIGTPYLIKNIDLLNWRLVQNPLIKYYYCNIKEFKIVWKKYNKDEVDIVAIIPENVRLKIEEKKIPSSTKINFIATSKERINCLIKAGFDPQGILNTFIVKPLTETINFGLIPFQMIDIDIY